MSYQSRQHSVCPVQRAWRFDHVLRRLVHDPARMLSSRVARGMTVLDFGCGPGFFLPKLAELVGPHGRIFAVDLQKVMLDRARRKIAGTGLESRVIFQHCQQQGFVPTAPLDFVLLFHVVHEVPDPRALLMAIHDQLRSSTGSILLVEPRGHVSGREFEETIRAASEAGYRLSERPRMMLDRAALLVRGLKSEIEAPSSGDDQSCRNR
jgi:SAM-dependent methyltransferase